jgi:predicted metal-dependent hydrolase
MVELSKVYQPIPYTLRRKRFSRVLRFAVYADGRIVVTAPVLLGKKAIERIIKEKSAWILEKLKFAEPRVPKISAAEAKAMYLKHKVDARKFAIERLEHFNQTYGLKWNRVSIKNSRTRWGSCSGKGNLNFNYKIALLPVELAEYIVVHELCHLAQMNHSPKFWRLVALTIPDYVARRKAIRKHEIQLQ